MGGCIVEWGWRDQRVPADDLALSSAVARAQDGDEAAFAALYRHVQPGLLGYLRGTVRESAEDVAAAVWGEIARDLPRFRGDGHGFRGWTADIARRHALDCLKRRRASTRPPNRLGHAPLLDGTDLTASAEALSVATAQALIARLPRAQAEAVLLRHVVRLDEAATARVMRRPGTVVRVLARRGLSGLDRLLAPHDLTHDVVRVLGEPG
ncbi:RNA polymerase sigma factor [Streptomyces sp. Y7]|uniref:RNA polymerase sigma factor n=1 Tax=Streptomyces sp. Y7 TaxID=3342392 RepID=UPI003711268D